MTRLFQCPLYTSLALQVNITRTQASGMASTIGKKRPAPSAAVPGAVRGGGDLQVTGDLQVGDGWETSSTMLARPTSVRATGSVVSGISMGGGGVSMVIDGRTLKYPAGSSVSIDSGRLYVNGKLVELKDDAEGKQSRFVRVDRLEIHGTVGAVHTTLAAVRVVGPVTRGIRTTLGPVQVTGSVTGDVSTTVGPVMIEWQVKGDVTSTSGTISCPGARRAKAQKIVNHF